MKDLLIIGLFSLLVMATSCMVEEPCIDERKIDPEAVCTMDWRPVCGCDGKTYGNECQAVNSGVLRWTAGECQ